ncbi:hypothetical protein EV127DRAFT_480454 [Xylaria flabelliformis]|nr:hypothetical protein EV127DRAFT_480454 [Xylaria flabelliformis]
MRPPCETRRRRRRRSCPPNLKLCRDPGAQRRGHRMASHPSSRQLNAAHSREGTSTQRPRNVPVSRAPVERYLDGLGQYPRSNNEVPCFRSHSRAHRRLLGIGPYWNPPRNPTTDTTAKVTWTKGPKLTDCEWMPTDDPPPPVAAAVAATSAAATTSIAPETSSPTTVCEEPEWSFTPPVANKRRRPCPPEAWSWNSNDSASHPLRHVGRARAKTSSAGNTPRPDNATALVRYRRPHEYKNPQDFGWPSKQPDIPTMMRYRRLTDGSLPTSSSWSSSSYTSQRGDLEHEFATWDPFWVHGDGVDHHE